MKNNILTIALAAVALAGVSSASARDCIYVTGSTAFRGTVNAVLHSKYSANLAATTGADTTLATTKGAGSLLFTNCPVNGNYYDISVAWSGSEAGIQSVASPDASPAKLQFFDPIATYTAVASQSVGSATTATITGKGVLAKATVTFADNQQKNSRFNTGQTNGLSSGSYQALTQAGVGVVPFAFLGNKTFPGDNIKTSDIRDLFSVGYTTYNNISGSTNISDKNTVVYYTGRNGDSGTRLNALLTSFWGKFTAVTGQATIGGGGSGAAITSLAPYAAGTINGIKFDAGDNGYSSGGSIVTKLNSVINSSTIVTGLATKGSYTNYLVSYAGVGDYSSQAGTGVKVLKYNGAVPRCFNSTSTALDQGYTNIITGGYPFWTVVQVAYNGSSTNPGASDFVTDVCVSGTGAVTTLASTDANLAPNIKLSDMKVTRADDGGIQTPDASKW
jgi:hypothetical protein